MLQARQFDPGVNFVDAEALFQGAAQRIQRRFPLAGQGVNDAPGVEQVGLAGVLVLLLDLESLPE